MSSASSQPSGFNGRSASWAAEVNGSAAARRAATLVAFALLAGCGPGQPTVPSGCNPGQCAGCCTAEGRCANEQSFEACGVGGAACARCAAGTVCAAGACLPPDGGSSVVRPGDTCATPLVLVPGSPPLQLRLASYRPDTQLSCATATRPDAVASLTLAAPTTLALFARTLSGGGRPTLALRRACADPASEVALSCVDQAQAQGTAAWLSELEAGSYSVWLQADADAVVALEAVALPNAGARCEVPAQLSVGLGQTRLRTTPTAVEPSGCSDTLAWGRLFALAVSDDSDLRVEATAPGVSLGLYEGCGSAPLACGAGALRRTGLSRGNPVLAALGSSPQGALELDVELRPPPPGERCPVPFEVSVGSAPRQLTGSTLGASSDSRSSCGGDGAPDVVYRVVSQVKGSLSASVEAADAGFQPVLSLFGPLCSGTLLTCSQPSRPGASTLQWSAADGYLWVSGADGGAGEYTLTLQVQPTGLGDTCDAPEVLQVAAPPSAVTVMGDTRRDNNDSPGTCGSTAPDHVYTVITRGPANLVATLESVGTQLVPSLASARPCARQLSCSPQGLTDAGSVQLRLGGLAPDTHTLWVDGLAGTSGPYALRVELKPPVPGDTCANPWVVPVDAGTPVTLSIDQAAYFDSTSFACGGAGFNDVHLWFRPLEVGTLSVTVQRADGGRPPLVSTACQFPGTLCTAPDAGVVRFASRVDDLVNGGLRISLDESGPEGAVVVGASLVPPASGDWCSGPILLPLDGGSAVTVTGDTRGLTHDFSQFCSFAPGPDVYYSVGARPYPRSVQATVTPTTPGFQPHLSLRNTDRTCARNDGAACAPLQPPDQSASLTSASVPANSIGLIVIDSPTPNAGGAFTLSVTVTPP